MSPRPCVQPRSPPAGCRPAPPQPPSRSTPTAASSRAALPSTSTSHRMKSSSLGERPRLFRVSYSQTREAPTRRACAPNAPRPLSGWTKGLFLTQTSAGRLVYLHRPAYRRHARALGVHGERPLDDFGRVAVAAAVGAQRYLQSPQRYVRLPRERPSLGIRLEPQWGHLMSCRQARCPAISSPFHALDWTNCTQSARLRNARENGE